jgi:hypothetical protein
MINSEDSKNCLECNKIFYKKDIKIPEQFVEYGWNRTKFCSAICGNRYREEKIYGHRRKIKRIELCKWCEKEFEANHINSICCHVNCYANYNRNKTTLREHKEKFKRICPVCNKEFMATTNRNFYCSINCLKTNYVITHRKKLLKIRAKTMYNLSLNDYTKFTEKCFICGFNKHISLHHIIPKFNGGKDEFNNYIGLCFNHHKMAHSGIYRNKIDFELMKKEWNEFLIKSYNNLNNKIVVNPITI